MGISSDGILCFGVQIEEGAELPWSEYDNDIDEWWMFKVHGFNHSFQIYDETGNYIGGIKPSEETINKFYAEREKFRESMPTLPVELVTHCSYDYPMYIIAASGSVLCASRGYPETKVSFDITEEQKKSVIDFCQKYGIKIDHEPSWILASIYG